MWSDSGELLASIDGLGAGVVVATESDAGWRAGGRATRGGQAATRASDGANGPRSLSNSPTSNMETLVQHGCFLARIA